MASNSLGISRPALIGVAVVVVVVGVIGGLLATQTLSPAPVSTPSPAPTPAASPQPTPTPEQQAVTFEVVLKEWAIEVNGEDNPPLTLNAGERVIVKVVNQGSFAHTFTITELNVDTGVLRPGESATIEFVADRTGSFSYFCSVAGHRERGMEGELSVA